MSFIGRTNELAALTKLYTMQGLKGAILYGRKRIGKTSLLLESAKEFPGKVIYYQCLNAINSINAKNLLAKVEMVFPSISVIGKPSLTDVLSLIFKLAKNEPLLLILDEYSYLQDQDFIDSYLQSLIDQNLDSNMKIILSGFYVNIMEHFLIMIIHFTEDSFIKYTCSILTITTVLFSIQMQARSIKSDIIPYSAESRIIFP